MGLNGHVEVDHGAMSSAVTEIDNTSAAIRSLMGQVQMAVADVSAHWGGDANAAFSQATAHWNEAGLRAGRALDDIHDGIHTSNHTYMGQEAQNADELRYAGAIVADFNIKI